MLRVHIVVNMSRHLSKWQYLFNFCALDGGNWILDLSFDRPSWHCWSPHGGNAPDICIRAGHLWSCVSFSYEVHLAYVSDSIEVSQPRFVSCSAKRRAERDSCVSFSEEKGHVSCFLAQTRGGFWERVYVSFSTSKGHVLFVYLTQGESDTYLILALAQTRGSFWERIHVSFST